MRTAKTAVTPLLPREFDLARVLRLMDAAGDIGLVLDGEGTILDVRARDPELSKLARRAWHGRPWSETVTVESQAKVSDLIAQALADTAANPRQVNHPAASGPDLPVLYSVSLMGSARATCKDALLVALGRDLRETLAMQRRLIDAQQSMERDYWRFREAETRYRNLFQATSEAVLIVDGSGQRVVEANPAATALLGNARVPGKWIGGPLALLFDPAVAEPLAAAVTAARSVGRHDRLAGRLAGSTAGVVIAINAFRHEQSSFLLVRLSSATPETAPRHARAALGGDHSMEAAFVQSASDALAFTDATGRVVAVNAAFVRLAQLANEDQARGEPLDRWVGRTGVELSVLLTNLREGGSAGLFTTDVRGTLGLVTEVEIAASALAGRSTPTYAFSLRDVGRRLAPQPGAASSSQASPEQLTELVGRVPLKQIVAESSDLIERLSIETALTMTKNNRAMAAQLLGLSRQSLYVKLRRFGMIAAGEPD